MEKTIRLNNSMPNLNCKIFRSCFHTGHMRHCASRGIWISHESLFDPTNILRKFVGLLDWLFVINYNYLSDSDGT